MSHEFDWLEFLYFAQDLAGLTVKTCSEETKFRIAISRAYYAAYWQARKYVEKTSYISPNGYYKHAEVLKFFYDRISSHPSYKSISVDLRKLYELRVKADYNDSNEVITRDMTSALSFANNVIAKITRLK